MAYWMGKFMITYFLHHFPHKVQPVILTGGFLEGEGVISFSYIWYQEVIKTWEIFWRGLGSFFMVGQLVYRTHCFWKNGLGARYGHRCEEGNVAKYLVYVSFFFFFLLLLLCLSPEIRRFKYSRIRRDGCESTPCSSLIGESRYFDIHVISSRVSWTIEVANMVSLSYIKVSLSSWWVWII